jgi:hypothetical protein
MCLPPAHSIRRDFVSTYEYREKHAKQGRLQASSISMCQSSMPDIWSTFSCYIQRSIYNLSQEKHLLLLPPPFHFHTNHALNTIFACLTCLAICFSEDLDQNLAWQKLGNKNAQTYPSPSGGLFLDGEERHMPDFNAHHLISQ